MSSYIPVALRQQVTLRARARCEYCRYPQSESFFIFEVEHVIAEKHGGLTMEANLALACPLCNRAKGSDLGSIDPETGLLTAFFHPRRDQWHEHFQLVGGRIEASTAAARVTIRILQFNTPERIAERAALLAVGLW